MTTLKPEHLTPHFQLLEFACHDRGGTAVPLRFIENAHKLAQQLEHIRAACGGQPIHILSGFRTAQHNRRIKGAVKSQHLTCSAADFVTAYGTPTKVAAVVRRLIADGTIHAGGLGVYRGFVHYDIREGGPVFWRG